MSVVGISGYQIMITHLLNLLMPHKNFKSYCLLFLICCLMISCVTRPQQKSNKIAPEELREDFDTLTRHIEKDVPDPFYSSSKTAYDSVKREVMAALNGSMTAMQFYRTVYPLIQILNDAHFAFIPGENSSKESANHPRLFFPFKVAIRNDQLFVLDNYSTDTAIEKGDEIISINRDPVRNIIEKMRSCNFKDSSGENFFERQYGDYFYEFLFRLWDYKDQFTITFSDKRTTTVRGVIGNQNCTEIGI